MADAQAVQVNFGKPFGLFALDGVTLMPHQILPMHIFEPRYRDLVMRALDGSGQFAMAVFAGTGWKQNYHGRPKLHRAVCLGQILQHEALEDGRYNILLQGVCRARIARELPAQEGTLFREAILEPVGVSVADGPALQDARARIEAMLAEGPLAQLTVAESLLEYLRNDDIPTPALLEVVSFTVLSEHVIPRETRYELLAEGNAATRARVIERELRSLQTLVERGQAQRPDRWPKGCSWN